MSRKTILMNQLKMARYNLSCYSADYLCTTPIEGKEDAFNEAAAEVEMLKEWLKEFEPVHNSVRYTANLAISLLKAIDKSILKMAGGGIADKDKAVYLRAYSADIHGAIKHLEAI